jgi:hypothetical protein
MVLCFHFSTCYVCPINFNGDLFLKFHDNHNCVYWGKRITKNVRMLTDLRNSRTCENKAYKAKLPLRLINQALCHKTQWRSGDVASPILISAIDGCEWSVSHPDPFTTNFVRDWVSIKDGLDGVLKRISCLARETLRAVQPIATLTGLLRLPGWNQ